MKPSADAPRSVWVVIHKIPCGEMPRAYFLHRYALTKRVECSLGADSTCLIVRYDRAEKGKKKP